MTLFYNNSVASKNQTIRKPYKLLLSFIQKIMKKSETLQIVQYYFFYFYKTLSKNSKIFLLKLFSFFVQLTFI